MLVELNGKQSSSFFSGIVSFGEGCKEIDKYGVYTKLDNKMLEWIEEQTQGK